MFNTMVKCKFSKNEIPRCLKGKNHNWKDSNKVHGESCICAKCGYDVLDNCYREGDNK